MVRVPERERVYGSRGRDGGADGSWYGGAMPLSPPPLSFALIHLLARSCVCVGGDVEDGGSGCV